MTDDIETEASTIKNNASFETKPQCKYTKKATTEVRIKYASKSPIINRTHNPFYQLWCYNQRGQNQQASRPAKHRSSAWEAKNSNQKFAPVVELCRAICSRLTRDTELWQLRHHLVPLCGHSVATRMVHIYSAKVRKKRSLRLSAMLRALNGRAILF